MTNFEHFAQVKASHSCMCHQQCYMQGKGTQFNKPRATFFQRRKELPWVGFEPTTLRSLGMSACEVYIIVLHTTTVLGFKYSSLSEDQIQGSQDLHSLSWITYHLLNITTLNYMTSVLDFHLQHSTHCSFVKQYIISIPETAFLSLYLPRLLILQSMQHRTKCSLMRFIFLSAQNWGKIHTYGGHKCTRLMFIVQCCDL